MSVARYYREMNEWRQRERQQQQYDSLRRRGLLPGKKPGDSKTAPVVRLDAQDLQKLMGFYRDHCWIRGVSSRAGYQAYVRIQNHLFDRHQYLARQEDRRHEDYFI